MVGLKDPNDKLSYQYANKVWPLKAELNCNGIPAGTSLEFVSAVNAGARRGLQAALIGPCGRILTIVYL
jgi:hypothetical protein